MKDILLVDVDYNDKNQITDLNLSKPSANPLKFLLLIFSCLLYN